MSSFFHRCRRKRLRKVRQNPTSTNWLNSISRNCWGLLKGHPWWREANGLIPDAACRKPCLHWGKEHPRGGPVLADSVALYILGPFSSVEGKIPEEHHEFLHSPQITAEALRVIVIPSIFFFDGNYCKKVFWSTEFLRCIFCYGVCKWGIVTFGCVSFLIYTNTLFMRFFS